ncbi:MAG TPA: cytochrome P450 [Streptosporangiaceae bacterium]|nr:cytochrome P450 [Streptosporangiaceae bacterium]
MNERVATDLATGAVDVLGFDPFDPAFRADPYVHYARLRAGGPLRRGRAGVWVTTSHALCGQVLRDPRFGHQPGGASGVFRAVAPPVDRRSFLSLDPPDHTRLRRLVSKAFTARLVERLRPRISELVDDLLAEVSGETDLIAALAWPLPVAIISELLGVPPEDKNRFKAWSDALARGLDPDFMLPPAEIERRERARDEFIDYFRALADRRRRAHGGRGGNGAGNRAVNGDDLLSALVAVSDQGDVLSEAELLATCILLLVAGHETTVSLIGNGALALLRNPGQLAWFRAHPEAAASAVEELLRYDPPVQLTARSALEDVELAGQRIERGQMILLLIGAANRDPAVFADPDRLDLTRKAERHLAFGLGIHYCLGAPLARLEGQIALTKLFGREVSLAGEVSYRDNLILRGPATLPVRVGPPRLTPA